MIEGPSRGASRCRPRIHTKGVAVATVIALQEPPLLLAVQRIVGGVEVEDDPLGLRRCSKRSTNRLASPCGSWSIL
jgi:hypothetical protein